MGDVPSKDPLSCPTCAAVYETESLLSSHIAQCCVVIKSEPLDCEDSSGQDAKTSKNAERRQRIIDCANREMPQSVPNIHVPDIKTEPVTDHEPVTCANSLEATQPGPSVDNNRSRSERRRGRKQTFNAPHIHKPIKKKPPPVKAPVLLAPRQIMPMAAPTQPVSRNTQPLQPAQPQAVLNVPQLLSPMSNVVHLSNPLMQQIPTQAMFNVNLATGNLQLGSVPSVLPVPQVSPVNVASGAMAPAIVPSAGLPFMPQIHASTSAKTDPSKGLMPMLIGNQIVFIPTVNNPGTALSTLPFNQSIHQISISSVKSLAVSQESSSHTLPSSTSQGGSALKRSTLSLEKQHARVPQQDINIVASSYKQTNTPQTTQSFSSPLMASNIIESKQAEKGFKINKVSVCGDSAKKDELSREITSTTCTSSHTVTSFIKAEPLDSSVCGQTDNHTDERQTMALSSGKSKETHVVRSTEGDCNTSCGHAGSSVDLNLNKQRNGQKTVTTKRSVVSSSKLDCTDDNETVNDDTNQTENTSSAKTATGNTHLDHATLMKKGVPRLDRGTSIIKSKKVVLNDSGHITSDKSHINSFVKNDKCGLSPYKSKCTAKKKRQMRKLRGKARVKDLASIKPQGKLMMTSLPNSNPTNLKFTPATKMQTMNLSSSSLAGSFIVQPNASPHQTPPSSAASKNPMTFVLPNQVHPAMSNIGGVQAQSLVQPQIIFPQHGAQPILASSSFAFPYPTQNPLSLASAQTQLVLPNGGIAGVSQVFPPRNPGIVLDNNGQGQNVLIQNITNNQPILIGANPSQQTTIQKSSKKGTDKSPQNVSIPKRCLPSMKMKAFRNKSSSTKPVTSQALVSIKPKPAHSSKVSTTVKSDVVETIQEDEAKCQIPEMSSISKGANLENMTSTQESESDNEKTRNSTSNQNVQNLVNDYDFKTSLLKKDIDIIEDSRNKNKSNMSEKMSTNDEHKLSKGNHDSNSSVEPETSNLFWGPLSQEQLQTILNNPDRLQQLVSLSGGQVVITSKSLTVQTTLCNTQTASQSQQSQNAMSSSLSSGQSLMMVSSLAKQPVMSTSMSSLLLPSPPQMTTGIISPPPMALPPLRKFTEGPRPPGSAMSEATQVTPTCTSNFLNQLPKLAPKPGLNDLLVEGQNRSSLVVGTTSMIEPTVNSNADKKSSQIEKPQLKFCGDIEMLATALKPCRIYMDKLPDTVTSRPTQQRKRKISCTEFVSAPSTSNKISGDNGRSRKKRMRRRRHHSVSVDPEWCARSEDQGIVPRSEEGCDSVPTKVVQESSVQGGQSACRKEEEGSSDRGMRRSGRIRDKPRLDYADLEQKPFKDLDDEEEEQEDEGKETGEEILETEFEIITEYAVEEQEEGFVLEPTEPSGEAATKNKTFSSEASSGGEIPLVIDESGVSNLSSREDSFPNVSERSPPVLSPATCDDPILKTEQIEENSSGLPTLEQAQMSSPETSLSQQVYYSSESESDMLDDDTAEDTVGGTKLKTVMKRHSQVTKFLVKHAARFTSNELTDDHFCSICGLYKTNGIFSLSKHLKKHLSGVLKCPSCSYEACHEGALCDHKLHVHGAQ